MLSYVQYIKCNPNIRYVCNNITAKKNELKTTYPTIERENATLFILLLIITNWKGQKVNTQTHDLYSYEAEFIQGLVQKGEKKLAQSFHFTFRYIDDVLSLNNNIFSDHLHFIASSKYVDFVERGILLSQKLLRQGYQSIKLRSSPKKFYGRHHELIGHYEKKCIRNHIWYSSSVISTFHHNRTEQRNNTTGTVYDVGNVYPSGAPDSTPGF